MRKQPVRQPYTLTAGDLDILHIVHEFHFITCDLLIKLKYSKGTKTTVQTKLKCLYENKYLDRRALPSVRGTKEFIYALSTKSINILKAMGFEGFSRFRPDEFRQFAFPHLDHALSLNSLLIEARLLTRDIPSIYLASMIHDLDLKKTPVRVTVERRLPHGGKREEKISIVPDAWLDFRMVVPDRPKPRRRCISLELDRGTQTNSGEFKKKLLAYYAYALSEEYKAVFATNLCLVAYATTSGDRRRDQMLAWCEQELTQQHLQHEANLYRFAALPRKEYHPQELFCSPIWYIPFESQPTSLLWQV